MEPRIFQVGNYFGKPGTFMWRLWYPWEPPVEIHPRPLRGGESFLWRRLSRNTWCSSSQNKICWTSQKPVHWGLLWFHLTGLWLCVTEMYLQNLNILHTHSSLGKKNGEWRNMVDFRKNRLSIFPSWPGLVQNVWFYWPMPRAHFLGVIFVYIKEYISLSILEKKISCWALYPLFIAFCFSTGEHRSFYGKSQPLSCQQPSFFFSFLGGFQLFSLSSTAQCHQRRKKPLTSSSGGMIEGCSIRRGIAVHASSVADWHGHCQVPAGHGSTSTWIHLRSRNMHCLTARAPLAEEGSLKKQTSGLFLPWPCFAWSN